MISCDNILEICEFLSDFDKISFLSITTDCHKLKNKVVFTSRHNLKKVKKLWYFKQFRQVIIHEKDNIQKLPSHIRHLTYIAKKSWYTLFGDEGQYRNYVSIDSSLIANVEKITFLEHWKSTNRKTYDSSTFRFPLKFSFVDYCIENNKTVNVEWVFDESLIFLRRTLLSIDNSRYSHTRNIIDHVIPGMTYSLTMC
jgi:hypothetical protein